MEFVRGSHQSKYRPLVKISDESQEIYSRLVADEGLSVEGTGAMAVGDVSFHASWALHRAMGNSTTELRQVFAIMYFEDGARLFDQIEGSQRIGYDVYFSELKPGDLTGSELMPRLF
jgi:NAD(P)H-nitrite reductase large subunit